MKSIRKQMLVYLMIGALFLFGMLIVTSNIILKDLPTQIKKQYSEIASARSDEVSKELEGFIDQITMISKSPIITKMDLKEIKDYLPKLILNEKHRNMTIAYPDGTGWTTTLQEVNILNQEQYEEIFEKDRDFMISQPFISPYTPETKEPIVLVAHGVKDLENNTIGLVNIVIKVDFLNNIVREINLKESGYSWILNKQGAVVAHSNPKTIVSRNVKDYVNNDEHIMDKVSNMDSGTLEYKDEKGEKIFGFFNKIDGSPDWTFIISIPEKEIYKEINNFKNTMLISIFLGFFLVIIFSIFYSKTLSNPILSLEEIFNKAANGDLNVRANENVSNELGMAAKSFNIMLEQIKDLTYKDTITDLYNYNGFLLELPYRIKKIINKSKVISLIIISIDDFKKINTIKGYEVGNEVLYYLGEKIKNFINADEIVARFLGDEFIIFLYGEEVSEIEERIYELRNLCNGEIKVRDYPFLLKTSIGASINENIDISIEEIIHQATVAKLIVKKMGGNNYRFYNFELDQFIIEEQKMENDLYHAIDNNELKLIYQPIIELSNNKIGATEALLRWTNPSYKTVSPLIIIELAEQSDLIFEIGEWVLREACKQNKDWQDKGYKPIIVSVNVSAIQFNQTNFVQMVSEILNDANMEPKYLELEITETSAMKNVDENLIKMRRLKNMGVRISIDDFGTGYSSLSYFTRFPIDTLKIDRSFITNILNDKNAQTIVNTIISIAETIKIKITAEGVEELEQLEYLKEKGCHKIQGYYFSRPIDPLEIEEMLEK
jgi:diguanylate cyclase (GGDEF)-like protein